MEIHPKNIFEEGSLSLLNVLAINSPYNTSLSNLVNFQCYTILYYIRILVVALNRWIKRINHYLTKEWKTYLFVHFNVESV